MAEHGGFHEAEELTGFAFFFKKLRTIIHAIY
jgi:hypothetical protein